jgi:hypothetical protein
LFLFLFLFLLFMFIYIRMSAYQKSVTGGNGVSYTYEVTGSGGNASVPNSTYFKDVSTNLIYYKNASGNAISMFEDASFATDGLVYVTVNGSDVTGERSNISKPFASLIGAAAAATAFDIIVVFPGLYSHDGTLLSANGVSWYFHKGAQVLCTTGVATAYVFNTAVGAAPANVYGHGRFLRAAGGSIGGMVNIGTDGVFECEYINNSSSGAVVAATSGPFKLKCDTTLIGSGGAVSVNITNSTGIVECPLLESIVITNGSTNIYGVNVNVPVVTGTLSVNGGSAILNCQKISTLNTSGGGILEINGFINTFTMSTHTVHSNATIYDATVTGGKLIGGIIGHILAQSAGYVDATFVGNSNVTTNNVNISGTAIAILKIDNYSSGTGCELVITGGDVTITGPSTRTSTANASTISAGKLTVRGTFNLPQTTSGFINASGTAIVDLTDSTINMTGVTTGTVNNVAILTTAAGVTIVCGGNVITTTDTSLISPMQSTVACNLIVKNSGFHTTYTGTFPGAAGPTGSGFTDVLALTAIVQNTSVQ